MILKGSQRAGGIQLAKHLMNTNENDHVTLHELRGFVADDLHGAFKEAYAVSWGTRCRQFLFSLSLSPPASESVPIAVFEKAIAEIEDKLGFDGQPRAIVFHEKDGRRHAHCVWSRINIESMTAIPVPHFKLKLKDVSRQLYIENNWRMPSGLANSIEANPLNFTRHEWQQAKRLGIDPKKIKEAFQDCWAMSDNLSAFKNALEARGYYLAQGDRRGFVAVDWRGEIYAVSRYVGVRAKELASRLGAPSQLPPVAETKERIAGQVSLKLQGFRRELQQEYDKARLGLRNKREFLVERQRQERSLFVHKQRLRAQAEAKMRSARFRKGLAAIWDWVSGKRATIRKQNEVECLACSARDTSELQNLVEQQLSERRALQLQIKSLNERHENEEFALREQITPELPNSHRDELVQSIKNRQKLASRL